MKCLRMICFFLASISCFFLLCSCGKERDSAKEQQLAEQMITLLVEDKPDEAYALFNSDELGVEEFRQSFEGIADSYQGGRDFTLAPKHVQKGEYTVTSGEMTYTVSIALSGDKISKFQLLEEPSGEWMTFSQNTVWQNLLLMVNILVLAFTAYTAVDALRHRVPNSILIAFGCIGLYINSIHNVVNGAYHMSGSVGWYSASRFLTYPSGNTQLIVSIPAFAILYWLLRRRLIEQKHQ